MEKEIDFKEVLRRWALGEVGSKEFGLPDYKNLRKKLKSNQFSNSDLDACLYRRKLFIMTIAQLNAKWLLKPISFIMKKLPEIFVVKDEGWKEKTNGSNLLIDAVRNSVDNPDRDSREYKILKNIENLGIDDFTGITLVYNTKAERYIAAEGHSRLIALYNYLIIKQKKLGMDIEVVVGITENNWVFDPILD